MAAQHKDELLALAAKEFSRLGVVLDQFDSDGALKKRDEDTSLKDVVAHRAHWIELFLGWYADGVAGKEVFFPAKGYKWNQLKAYNKMLRDQHAGLDWSDARNALSSKHRKLMRFLHKHTNSELYGAPMQGAKNQWTAGRFAEAAGPSHYRSAAKFARQCLRADQIE